MSQDFDIKCPKCGEAIHLDETLAGPVIARIRLEANNTIRRAQEEADARVLKVTAQEASLAAKEVELMEREASVRTQVNQSLAIERKKIAATERENILKELSPGMEAERTRAKDLQEKLETAQRAELQLRLEKDAVDERSKNLELEIARKVDQHRRVIEEQTRKEIGDVARLKIAEAEQALSDSQHEVDAKTKLAIDLAATLAAKEVELIEKKASVQTQVNQVLAAERKKIAAIERENIFKELSPEMEAARAKSEELQQKLDTSQRAELQLRQEKESINQRAKDMELEIARKVDEQRKAIHEQASKEADEAARLKIAERDKTISDMQIKLEEAQRKGSQGSQQLQGEVLELDFESTLRQLFPQDTIEPVKTGTKGGDILQRVFGQMTRPIGTIFWETKRAQAWGGDWTTKAKQDAAEAKAEVALIVSEALPKGIQDFGFQDGVWCVKPGHAVMLGLAIRQGVISTADARQGSLGRETKKDRLYDYMIGPEFRTTIEGIALPFQELYDELAAEKRSTQTRWKRQERRLERVLANIASLQGDLQGIAGNEMPQLQGFEPEVAEMNLLE
jgi:hypothetical protein